MRGLTRRGRLVVLGAALAGVLVVGAASAAVGVLNPFGNNEVGQKVQGATLLPTNQWVSPLGNRILDNNARLVSSTLSPDGTDVAALSWNDFSGFVTIVNVKTGHIVQQLPLNTGPAGNQDTSVAADGPLYSPDGTDVVGPPDRVPRSLQRQCRRHDLHHADGDDPAVRL